MEEVLYWYNICAAFLSCISFLSNLRSLIYIVQTFDLKQCLYYILFLEAIVGMTAMLLSMILFSMATTSESHGQYFCSRLFVVSQLSSFMSSLCNFMISFVR